MAFNHNFTRHFRIFTCIFFFRCSLSLISSHLQISAAFVRLLFKQSTFNWWIEGYKNGDHQQSRGNSAANYNHIFNVKNTTHKMPKFISTAFGYHSSHKFVRFPHIDSLHKFTNYAFYWMAQRKYALSQEFAVHLNNSPINGFCATQKQCNSLKQNQFMRDSNEFVAEICLILWLKQSLAWNLLFSVNSFMFVFFLYFESPIWFQSIL